MTSSQVECFFAAAEYKSFTKAARHLYMTMAAVSKNIQAPERELDGSLFWRGQSLTLPPAGTILPETMKRSRITFFRALEEARAITRELTGTLSFGFLKGQKLEQDEICTVEEVIENLIILRRETGDSCMVELSDFEHHFLAEE